MKELFEKRNQKKAALDALLKKAKLEERAFTEDEKAQFDALEAEIRALDETIAAEERAQKIIDKPVPAAPAPAAQLTTEQIEERAFEDFPCQC